MADQGRWFKLWCSSATDEKLEALSLENWARWARLGVYMKRHGTSGSLVFDLHSQSTARGIVSALRVSAGCSAGEMRVRVFSCLSVLPGVIVQWTDEEKSRLSVRFTNWKKYQEDSSFVRTRRWRERSKSSDDPSPSPRDDPKPSPVTVPEEKRREVTPLPPLSQEPGSNGTEAPQPSATMPPLTRHGHFDGCDCPSCARALRKA